MRLVEVGFVNNVEQVKSHTLFKKVVLVVNNASRFGFARIVRWDRSSLRRGEEAEVSPVFQTL